MINKITAFVIGLALPIAGYIMTATTVIQYQQDAPALQDDGEPAIPTAPVIPIEEPEPLPKGVICLDDCPLIEAQIREHFEGVPIMIEIARCESTYRQFDKTGEPLKNPNSTATGVFQLMASYHREPARKLGYDIDTVEGNLGYAMVMYKQSGTSPWEDSRSCWGKHLAYAR